MAEASNGSWPAGQVLPMDGTEQRAFNSLRCSKLHALMKDEHARLDELLGHAMDGCGSADAQAYQDFRQGLLRHIAIEEKILLPAAQRRRDGEPLPLAGKLKLDHGALAALVMLPPLASTLRALRAVLNAHNPLEDAPGGVYEQCECLMKSGMDDLLARCERASNVPVSSWAANARVLAAAKRVLTRAGYDASLLE